MHLKHKRDCCQVTDYIRPLFPTVLYTPPSRFVCEIWRCYIIFILYSSSCNLRDWQARGDVHFDSGYDNIFIMHVSSCKKLFLAFYINNYNIKTFWCKKTPTCNERCVMSRHNINDICDFQIQFLTLNNYFNDKPINI